MGAILKKRKVNVNFMIYSSGYRKHEGRKSVKYDKSRKIEYTWRGNIGNFVFLFFFFACYFVPLAIPYLGFSFVYYSSCFLLIMAVSGSKRKAKTFKDEEYFISAVPTNQVGYSVLVTFKCLHR